jgi:hypothetical protein
MIHRPQGHHPNHNNAMKNKAIEIVAFILGLLTAVAGILTLPTVAMLPKEWQPYIGVCLALVVVGKNGAYVILDFADDGQLNKSYKIPAAVKLLLLCGLALCLVACGTNGAGQKTFVGLTKADWAVVTKDAGMAAGKAALSAGMASYGTRKLTSAKDVIDVEPSADVPAVQTTTQPEGETAGGWFSTLINLFQ